MNSQFPEPKNSSVPLTELAGSPAVVPVREEKKPSLRKRIHVAGQGMTEYILILALVALAAFAVINIFGGQIVSMFQNATTQLNTANGLIGGNNN